MKIDAIRGKLRQYKEFFSLEKRISALWEIEEHFRENWNLNTGNPVEMFDRSLQSNISRNYWVGDAYSPKEWMLKFLEMEPDFVLQAFRELFDEGLDVEQRMDRFDFYSEQLLAQYRRKNKTTVETRHHQDYSALSLYLSLKYPAVYAPYRFEWLAGACSAFGAKPEPTVDDPGRFFKIVRIASRFMYEDTELEDMYERELRVRKLNFHKPFSTLYPAAEFCAYCGGKSMP